MRPLRSCPRLVLGIAITLAMSCLALSCSRTDAGSASSATSVGGLPLPATNTNEREAGPPVPGGQLTVGLHGETNDFNPANGQWSIASFAMANALLDPLVALDDQGIAHPYLAESISADAEFTSWVIKLRPGVTFHDGAAVDAAAVKRNLDNVRSSAITGKAFTVVDSIEVTDGLTVTVRMKRPWATFPATLAAQPGYIVAPSMLDDPAGANARIVGSGPFVFQDRQRDSFVKTSRNDHYWLKDKDGAQLPYLQSLDFRIITDATSRSNALAAGDINAMDVVNSSDVLSATAQAAARGEVQRLSNEKAETDEVVLAFNTSREPFNDPIAREALAYGTDQNQMVDTAYHGAMPAAWGMFSEGSPYYITPQQAGYPGHDVEKAKSLVAEYERKHGKPLEFTVLTVADPDSLAVMQTYQADLADLGVTMKINSVELTQLIARIIVSGEYEAAVFTMWSSPTPDQGYVFLATPPNPNGISLNYTRFDDPDITAALDAFRATNDPKQRIDQMTKVQQSLARNLQVLFIAHQRASFIYGNNVHGFTAAVFPGTERPAYDPYPETPFYAYVWETPQ